MTAYEAEIIPGIENIAIQELAALTGTPRRAPQQSRPGFVRFRLRHKAQNPAGPLSALRSIVAVYAVHHFAVPRPKALLGHQHFTRLTQLLRRQMQGWQPENSNLSLGLGAAGAESAVLRRLKHALANALDLPLAADGKGQLYLRLLRPPEKSGWEILVRTSPQPLATRAWRICSKPGALNATVAYAMTALAAPPPGSPATAVNFCSGSATILIEHALSRPNDTLIALDSDAAMLAAAIQNCRASRTHHRIHHLRADARRSPLPSKTADRLYADLPFGNHIGSHSDNRRLYPAILREAARLARQNARFILLTHEIKLLHRCLPPSAWQIQSETPISLSGLHPRLFVLERKAARM